jgi:hypothetical protein
VRCVAYLGFCLPHLCRWWINPLFAHHAGIIGQESLEGGTTFDDNNAYAVVIEGKNEVNTLPDGSLRYLTSMSDRGRFRLSAATPKSREPIRVLRSRNDNGIWGPKAGIRYDGLVDWPYYLYIAIADMSIVRCERMVRPLGQRRRGCEWSLKAGRRYLIRDCAPTTRRYSAGRSPQTSNERRY